MVHQEPALFSFKIIETGSVGKALAVPNMKT